VACVAVQASPVNKTSVGEGEGKIKWRQVVKSEIMIKCDRKKKVCLPAGENKKVLLSKCDKKGICKLARTTWVTCDIKGLHCKVTKNVYTSIGKMYLKKQCSKDAKRCKKGMKGYSKRFCKAIEAECSKHGDGDADGAHIDIKNLCAKCNKEGHCDIVKCKDGDDDDDEDGKAEEHCGRVCGASRSPTGYTEEHVCKDAKYGKKVCGIECAGKCDPHHHCTVTEICTLSGKVVKRYLYGNTVTDFTRVGEDDGAHLKGVSACMQCEKKGDKTHCKEVKCKDGDDDDDDEE